MANAPFFAALDLRLWPCVFGRAGLIYLSLPRVKLMSAPVGILGRVPLRSRQMADV